MSKHACVRRGVFLALLLLLILAFGQAHAHLPRLVIDEQFVEVRGPEISQAFYAQLKGSPDVYEINAHEGFLLYVNILVPDLPGISTDISATVTRREAEEREEHLAFLDGETHSWESFYEPFAGDSYLMGPEFEKTVPAGLYRIEVTHPRNTGKYVLSVGKQEVFTPAEMIHTIRVLPALKRDFFEKSPLSAYLNLVGLFMLILGVLIALAVYFVLRWGLRKVRRS